MRTRGGTQRILLHYGLGDAQVSWLGMVRGAPLRTAAAGADICVCGVYASQEMISRSTKAVVFESNVQARGSGRHDDALTRE